MNVAIVGCGLIGDKRATTLAKVAASGAGKDKLVAVCDIDMGRASKLAEKHKCDAVESWQDIIARKDVDIVVIAVIHGELAKIADAALAAGKHVLVEKPAARWASELETLVGRYPDYRKKGLVAKVGFNHRFHPALTKAREIFDSGKIGELMFIRGRYGHGGRVGYEKEWRADPELSGGGELLDQGMHLIDLSRWFLGDFPAENVWGRAKTYFWDMKVDDNAFLTLETKKGQIAQLQVTWTEWKNLFSFEIYGQHGKLHIEGLGGSYGLEKLSYYQMLPAMGPPETIIYEYPGADLSWDEEWKEFRSAIDQNRAPLGDLMDAYAAHLIIAKIYKGNEK